MQKDNKLKLSKVNAIMIIKIRRSKVNNNLQQATLIT